MRKSNLPNLVELRKARGITRAQLGDALGLAERSIGRYENGESDPVLGDLKKMAAYFGVSVSYLIGEAKQ
jgi:transcriptional regulator with XRE-family HTH domain